MTRRPSQAPLLAALAALALAQGCDSSSGPSPYVGPAPDAGPPPLTDRYALQNGLRALWVDHVAWTRAVIVGVAAGLPETGAAVDRLLQNQAAIGDAIKPVYGNAAGDALTALLKEHIGIAAELLGAAKAGEATKLADAKARWTRNGEAIAQFLAGANPSWPLADLKAMMRTHLDQTLAEATAYLSRDWEGAIRGSDAAAAHILMLADALAEGVAKQFPDKIARSPLSAKSEELHRAMRALWADHVLWTRAYLTSAIAGLEDTPATAARLLRNQDELGAAVGSVYGKAAGEALAALLREHITIAVEIVAAATSTGKDRQEKLAEAQSRWRANADRIASFLASANPSWSLADLKAMMRMHLDQTLAAATARLAGDWAGEIRASDQIMTHILAMADALSDGIVKQFPNAF